MAQTDRSVFISPQIVHFIRHAEGTHNEAARLHGEAAYRDWAWEVRVWGGERCVCMGWN